jgi:malonate-semialdehyde dehydrogenase (acetylating)/methylmalonate-semialdehyde dehydrogenase
MVYTVAHYIAGKPCIEKSTQAHDIKNPAQGETIGRVDFASDALCATAIAHAKQAWPNWSETPAIKRARVLFKFRELLEKYQQDLAQMVTREHGKTLDDAKASVARGIELVEFHCGLISQWQHHFSANVAQGIDCYSLRQALGICAGVSPFNFPVMVPVWMIIPAIACGNAFILKPSEQDPSAPVRLMELLSEAGLPPGIAQCLQGDKHTVDYLLKAPEIASFTAVASTPVAESIYQRAIAAGKRAHTFGGAKNHAVVMPDANIPQAAQAIVGAAYGSAGERCMAISVIVAVGDETAEQLLQELKPRIEAIRIDAGDKPDCDMGPLISQAHRQRVLAAIEQGVEDGAKLIVDGRNYTHPHYPQGYFVGPNLFDHVEEHMSIYQQEIFGPVLVIVRVKDFEQAIALVNRHPYGNGTAIFTQQGYFAREYAERVQVGMVGVNVPIPVPMVSHSFGGWKRSSFGDTFMHGMESIHFYSKLKTVTSKWPISDITETAFAMTSHR